MIDIIIPTCKHWAAIQEQIQEIEKNTPEEHRISFTNFTSGSAAENRNAAHLMADSKYIVSCDDDIRGYYPGWLTELISPLEMFPDMRFVSARYLKTNGKDLNFMMCSRNDLSLKFEEVPRCPTGCFAYRKEDFDALVGFHNYCSLPFDVGFVGSGWEDNAICHDLKMRFPGTRIVINNDCKLIHINEQKNQIPFLKENRKYFFDSGRIES